MRIEKSIHLGYIKQQMQEQIIYQKSIHDEEDSLKKLAMYLVDEIGEKLFVLKKEHVMIERYQFRFPSMLLDAIVPKEEDNPSISSFN